MCDTPNEPCAALADAIATIERLGKEYNNYVIHSAENEQYLHAQLFASQEEVNHLNKMYADTHKWAGRLEKERDKVATDCLQAISGTACTPVEGYVKAGMHWIASDLRSLVKEHKELQAQLSHYEKDREFMVEDSNRCKAANSQLQMKLDHYEGAVEIWGTINSTGVAFHYSEFDRHKLFHGQTVKVLVMPAEVGECSHQANQ